jgi:hypothetical protein
MAQWQSGNLRAAEATLLAGLALSPGFKPASDLLKRLQSR